MGIERIRNCFSEPAPLFLIDEPSGFAASMKKKGLAYQMQRSVELLEEKLLAKGEPHILQLRVECGENGEPLVWVFAADGKELAQGNGLFARECFQRDARAFMNECEAAVSCADLPRLDEHDYKLLCIMRDVERFQTAKIS